MAPDNGQEGNKVSGHVPKGKSAMALAGISREQLFHLFALWLLLAFLLSNMEESIMNTSANAPEKEAPIDLEALSTQTESTSSLSYRFTHYFPRYTLKKSGVIGIEERPPAGTAFILGIQHVLAMFGATVAAPLQLGFDVNTALFFSGIGTLIFYTITAGRVPSYVGSSFGFIGVVQSVTNYKYQPGVNGLNPNADIATGGILVCGLVYAGVGLLVIALGVDWVNFLLPPVVTGAIIMVIGLNLSGTAISQAAASGFDGYMALTTILCTVLIAQYAPSIFRRLPILCGTICGYVINLICGYTGAGPRIDFSGVSSAPWAAPPNFFPPKFESAAISTIVPVVIVLTAENLGHIKAVGAMTNTNLDRYIGRGFLGDAIATVVSASGGGTGTTTYGENISTLGITKVFSTVVFLIAATIAIILGFLPKFGAVIRSIPSGVFGGISIILYGLIAVTGARVWVDRGVDFSVSRNLLTAGVIVVLGSGMTTTRIVWGPVQFDGIGTATFSGIILWQLLSLDDHLRWLRGVMHEKGWRLRRKDNQE